MPGMLSERDAEQRCDAEQAGFTCNRQMRERDACEIALHHEEHTDRCDLHRLVPAKYQSELMSVVERRLKSHGVPDCSSSLATR